MNRFTMLGLLCLGVLSVVALMAIPAHASLTPSRAGTILSAASTDSAITETGPGGSYTVQCPTSEITGTIEGADRISIRITSSESPEQTCSVSGVSVTVRCNANNWLTLQVVSSVAGSSASFNASLDRTFECTISVPLAGCSISILGPQGPFAGAATYSQATRALRLSIRTLASRAIPAGSLCDSRGTITISGTYLLSAPRGGLTIS